MKSLIPVLIIGLVLFLLVLGARCSQRAMHRYETAVGASEDPNSAPNKLAEGERMARAFPDTLLSKNGIRYKIMVPGEAAKPIAGNRVLVHYAARLLDGTQFDSSHEREKPIEFTLLKGEVIQGIDQSVLDMREGEKRLVVIPYRFAYGDAGAPDGVPRRATLVYELELVKVLGAEEKE